MAKLCMIEREKKRDHLVKKYAAKRTELRDIIRNHDSSMEDKMAAQSALQKLPRDSNAVRQRSRCVITGRGRGVYSKFGLSRHKLRELAAGFIPGLHKASW